MPCGGIYPIDDRSPNLRCFHCDRHDPKPTHFVEEWDAYVHSGCVVPFLQTEEGKIIIKHKHEVVINFALA
jgi:hypothetical protein